jgi:FkbM family methyltransferase
MCFSSLAVWLSRQRRLPYKFRRSLIKRLYPAMLRDFSFEAEYFDPSLGLRFRGNIVNYIDRLIYFCGAHEKFMLCLLRDYVRRAKAQSPQAALAYIDVGANAGNHALFMARLVSRVHAFEPYPRVRTQLEENITLNGIGNITVYPFGLSNEDATLPFYAAPDSNLGAASFFADHKQDNYYLGDMQLKCGDALHLPKIDILKADVEGFEKFVLEGLAETIRRDRPLMIVELSAKTRETLGGEQALYALFPPNYRFYYFAKASHDSGKYQLAPFDYARLSKLQDVIAVPQEKAQFLPLVSP